MKTLFSLTLKNLADKKIRFVLTSLSVILGVMFTVGVFIFTDSLRQVFGTLADDIASGVDLTVRSEQAFGNRLLAPTIDPELAGVIEQVDGVKATSPGIIENNVVIVKTDGSPVESGGNNNAPKFGVNWDDNPEFSDLYLTMGRQPSARNEFAVNTNAFEDNELQIDRRYSIVLPSTGPEAFTLVGTFNFADPDEDKSIGAVLTAFDTPTAEMVLRPDGGWNEISVLIEDDADEEIVSQLISQEIANAGYSNIEVVSSEEIAEEQEEVFDEIINIFQTFLLAFAGVILLVSIFVIFNTFTIVLGQRIREIGLMRALGATGRQIFSSTVGEAVAVGLFSSGVGIAAGLGLAYLLRFVSDQANFDLGLDALVLSSRTIILAFIVGTGVTLVSAVVPALRSRRVSPMAALRDDLTIDARIVKQHTIIGSVLVGLGLFFTVFAFTADWQPMILYALIATFCLAIGGKRLNQRLNLGHWFVLAQGAAFLIASVVAGFESGEQAVALGLGALILIIGVNLISPVFVPNLMRGVGTPIRWMSKVTGKLSTENAARAPRRTSTTAAALMIGLALVSTVSLVASSLKATFADVLENTVKSDWFLCIGSCNDPNSTFSPNLADNIRDQPEFSSVLNFRFAEEGFIYKGEVGEVDRTGDGSGDNIKSVLGTNFSELENHIDVGLVDGSFSQANTQDGLAIYDEAAEDNNLVVGDSVLLEFNDGTQAPFRVVALYDDSRILGNWTIDIAAWDAYLPQSQDTFVSVVNAPGVTEQQAEVAISTAAVNYPQVNVQTKQEFNDSQTGQIDQIVIIVNIFLFLALVVAFIGIANTLALSIIERTRELGLLRAVGMKRRQMLLMVLWEGVLIAIFGGLLGISMGIVFGVTAVTVIPDEFISTLDIPWQTLIYYLVGAGVAGLISALLPARRASRLNVLDAIATE